MSPATFGSAPKKKESKGVDRVDIENFVTSRHDTDHVDIASGHEFTLSKKEEFFNENNCSAASKRSNNETVTNLEQTPLEQQHSIDTNTKSAFGTRENPSTS